MGEGKGLTVKIENGKARMTVAHRLFRGVFISDGRRKRRKATGRTGGV